MTSEPTVNVAAYKFTTLNDLEAIRDALRNACKSLELRGTILLSSEGINLFLAGSRDAVDRILKIIRDYDSFADIQVKESLSDNQPFNRMLVKIKREIIAFGVEGIEPQRRTSPKLSAKELKSWLDEGRRLRLVDVRNQYEVDLGSFKSAEHLAIHHFRDFPSAARQLPEGAKHEPLVMFCTGGIRCEKAGPYLEALGFEQVYQLDGGILKYFEECGGTHYEGGCFVFDSRVVLDPQLQPTGAIQCFACQAILNHEDVQSTKFVFGKSCPNCFRTRQQAQAEKLQKRQSALDRIAASQPGSKPYLNRRLMHVPHRMDGYSLIDFLCSFHPPTLKGDWLAWISAGSITHRGERVTPDRIVREGERFEQLQPEFVEPGVADKIPILFEDDAIVVVDKPAPLPVHPGGRFNRNSLLAFMCEAYRPEKLRVANRLDANTTGLVVLCRKYASARILQPQFGTDAVDKRYWLRVVGHPRLDRFDCSEPIGMETLAAGARSIDPAGLRSLTEFEVQARLPDGSSLLDAKTHSGRTHQIRVHAWHLGFPVMGDPMYLPGGKMGEQQTIGMGSHPMCLHAWKLRFRHPFTSELMEFTSSKPTWGKSFDP